VFLKPNFIGHDCLIALNMHLRDISRLILEFNMLGVVLLQQELIIMLVDLHVFFLNVFLLYLHEVGELLCLFVFFWEGEVFFLLMFVLLIGLWAINLTYSWQVIKNNW
jgi:hypothetical protein